MFPSPIPTSHSELIKILSFCEIWVSHAVLWRIRSFWIWCCTVLWKFTYILKESIASILQAQDESLLTLKLVAEVYLWNFSKFPLHQSYTHIFIHRNKWIIYPRKLYSSYSSLLFSSLSSSLIPPLSHTHTHTHTRVSTCSYCSNC